MYLIGRRFFDPFTISGKPLFLFVMNEAPNFDNGSVTLLKSLMDKLLSPTNLIGLGEFIISPSNNLPSVPEFLASKVRLFLYL